MHWPHVTRFVDFSTIVRCLPVATFLNYGSDMEQAITDNATSTTIRVTRDQAPALRTCTRRTSLAIELVSARPLRTAREPSASPNRDRSATLVRTAGQSVSPVMSDEIGQIADPSIVGWQLSKPCDGWPSRKPESQRYRSRWRRALCLGMPQPSTATHCGAQQNRAADMGDTPHLCTCATPCAPHARRGHSWRTQLVLRSRCIMAPPERKR